MRVCLTVVNGAPAVVVVMSEEEVTAATVTDAAMAGLIGADAEPGLPVFDKDAKGEIELFVGRAAQLAMLACEREVMVLDAADEP